MSGAATSPGLHCSICDVAIKNMADAQRVRDRGRESGQVRCLNYEGCMVRAAINRRREIGAEEPTKVQGASS